MPVFQYTALDDSGARQKGILEADGTKQVRQLLRAKGWFPLSIETSAKAKTEEKKEKIQIPFARYRIPKRQLTLITRQLSTLLEGSIPLEQALQLIASQYQKPKIKNVILSINSKVREGYSLAIALAEFPETFPEIYRATVAAGEHAGHLDVALARLADYNEASHRSVQKIQLALLYPVILSLISVTAVIFLLGYVMPNVVRVFVDSNQELPFLTTIMITLSNFLRSYGLLMLVLMAGGGLVFSNALKNQEFRYRLHERLLKLPYLGKLFIAISIARFIRTLGTLNKNGIPIVDAINISSKVISNLYLRKKIEDAAQNVKEGESLKTALDKTGFFPQIALYMIASGESSGKLEEMLERAAHNQEFELETKVAFLVGIFEPAMILFMGIVVLMFVLAILLPILNLSQVIK